MEKSKVIVVVAGVAAVIVGAVVLTRTTPRSAGGGGAGLKTESPAVSQIEPLEVGVAPVPSTKSGQAASPSSRAILINPSTLNSAPKNLGQAEGPTTTIMNLNGQQYHLLVADDPAEWQLGLMNRTKLEGFDGMAFVFPKSEPRTFWNKDTHLDLIVIWANGTSVIGVVGLPSIDKTKTVESVSSPGPVDRVIELVVR